MASPGSQGTASVRAVLALYEAIRDSRVADVQALGDPDVVCQPEVRPGLTVYYLLEKPFTETTLLTRVRRAIDNGTHPPT
jgi:hypothetical protein